MNYMDGVRTESYQHNPGNTRTFSGMNPSLIQNLRTFSCCIPSYPPPRTANTRSSRALTLTHAMSSELKETQQRVSEIRSSSSLVGGRLVLGSTALSSTSRDLRRRLAVLVSADDRDASARFQGRLAIMLDVCERNTRSFYNTLQGFNSH